jgi:acyl carrier protein
VIEPELADITIRSLIERHLVEQFFPGSNRKIETNESLFALGILDSLAFVQLLSFIEREFGITIDDDDVVVENFQNIDAIAQFVKHAQQTNKKKAST